MAETTPELLETPATTPTPTSYGLKRSLGFWDILMITVMGISLAFTGWLPFSTLAGMFPTAELSILVSAGLVLVLIHTFTFSAMGAVFPYAASDYVTSSRILSPFLGFVASWIQTMFLALLAGGLAAWTAQSAVPTLAQSLGFLLGNAGLITLASSIAEPATASLIMVLILVLAFGLASLGHREIRLVLLIVFGIMIVAWLVVIVQMLTGQPQAVRDGWNLALGSGTFQQVLVDAKSLAMPTTPNPGLGAIVGVVLSLGIYFGGFLPSQLAGETKKAGRNLSLGSLLGIILVWALILVAIIFTQRLFTAEWLTSEAYIFQNYNFGMQLPWINFYAGIANQQPVLVILTSVGWLVAFVAMIQMLLMAASRSIWAWSQDGLTPSFVGLLHKREKTPLIALFIAGLVAILGGLAALLNAAWIPQRLFVWVVAASQLIPVLALIILPFKDRELTDHAGGIFAFRLLGIPFISLAGIISLLFLVVVLVGPFLLDIVPAKVMTNQIYLLVGLAGTGVLWFIVRLLILRRSGTKLKDKIKYLPEVD